MSTGGVHSTIDYFLVSRALAPVVDRVVIQEAWPSSPHKPVSLWFKADMPTMWQRVLKQPAPLPLEVPIGCAPRPPEWPEVPQAANEDEVTQLWGQLVLCMEKEVLGLHDES